LTTSRLIADKNKNLAASLNRSLLQ